MLIIKDSVGRSLNIKSTPQRIVSLSSMMSGLLCELSLESKIIGVTNQCRQPYYLKATKLIVGDETAPIIEKIEALQPDIIFSENNLLSESQIADLQRVAPVFVSKIDSLQEAKNLISQLGIILKCKTESTRFIQKLDFRLNDFQSFMKQKEMRKIACFVSTWKSVETTPYLSEMMQLNKFENIYQTEEETEVNIMRIRFDGDPTVILLATDRFEFTDEHAFEVAEYANRSATVFVDSQMFCRFGVHTLKAFDYFKKMHQRLESHF
ncbi:MAG: ABC transporter substrate-binding protein [Flavobacteriaceae bacterium]|nr:ABC transporter substrate-binding protein [Flavobacteriaceae bacterium]